MRHRKIPTLTCLSFSHSILNCQPDLLLAKCHQSMTPSTNLTYPFHDNTSKPFDVASLFKPADPWCPSGTEPLPRWSPVWLTRLESPKAFPARDGTTATLDISLLLRPKDQDDAVPSSLSSVAPAPLVASSASAKRTLPSHPAESPAKKQSKWSPEEDAIIIDLRGTGMKWEDISKKLPGRSPISCRLHYQNYLERRSEWNEERKDKLARLYER